MPAGRLAHSARLTSMATAITTAGTAGRWRSISRPFKTCMARTCPTTLMPIPTYCPISMMLPAARALTTPASGMRAELTRSSTTAFGMRPSTYGPRPWTTLVTRGAEALHASGTSKPDDIRRKEDSSSPVTRVIEGGRLCELNRPLQQCLPLAMVEASTDINLVNRIAAGDKLAMQALFARHRTGTYRWLRMVHDEALAEDLLSEVFLDVW